MRGETTKEGVPCSGLISVQQPAPGYHPERDSSPLLPFLHPLPRPTFGAAVGANAFLSSHSEVPQSRVRYLEMPAPPHSYSLVQASAPDGGQVGEDTEVVHVGRPGLDVQVA